MEAGGPGDRLSTVVLMFNFTVFKSNTGAVKGKQETKKEKSKTSPEKCWKSMECAEYGVCCANNFMYGKTNSSIKFLINTQRVAKHLVFYFFF